ncbi:hypothetical protein LSH36_207g01016 [Paralvinella palmiformis]|uniref:Uncharacterized protein n=1 Tax=Paralvinella palmiformis TaxID=53620 RepID=A0AAD9JP68_9ANNE|nr:hypothetical protein LSH36_207g01016 [Paralvinella palmiformis]
MDQTSLDGPSTNRKLYEDLAEQRNSEDVPMLMNMGSCSLHEIHGIFKRGAQMTETLCAYQTVYDGITKMECKVHEVVISKEMLQSCKFSHQRFHTRMEKQKEKSKASAADEKIKEI